MKNKRDLLKALLVSTFLIPPPIEPIGDKGFGLGCTTIQAQNPAWVVGNELVRLPTTGTPITASLLPQPSDPNVPSELQYTGAIPGLSSHVQLDDRGLILFFIIDGSVYDGEGYLIAEGNEYTPNAWWDEDGNFPDGQLAKGTGEVTTAPVPGRCGMWYVFFTRIAPSANSPHQLGFGVIDMSMSNPNFPLGSGRKGKLFEQLDYDPGNGGISNVLIGEDPSSGLFNLNPDDQIPSLIPFQNNNILMKVITVGLQDGGQRTFLLVANDQHVVKYELLNEGIIHLGNEELLYPPGLTPSLMHGKGELEAYDSSGLVRVALSYTMNFNILEPNPPPSLTVLVLETMVLNANSPGFEQLGTSNPVIVDIAPWSQVMPDAAGGVVALPATGGVEFSRDGRYIYLLKSFANDLPSRLCYYDWQTSTLTALEIPNDLEFVDGKLERSSSDVGADALYLCGTDTEGNVKLGALLNTSSPSIANWVPNVIDFTNASLGTSLYLGALTTTPLDHYHLLPKQTGGDMSQVVLTSDICCETLMAITGYTNYVAPTGNHTWTANNNPFMDHPEVRVVGNFTVPAGSHITATGLDFRFAADGAMIIEPGGSLVCHGCTFRNNPCDERWKGIELHGNFAQHQGGFPYPEHQGFLLLNNSTVKNAEIGVLVAHRNAQGNIVKTKEGGVLRTLNGTRFENNRQGVFFRPYQNFNPTTGVKLRNLSRFNNTTFTVNADYPERNTNYDFLHHMQLWRVDGIQITACAFKNELADNFFAITGSYPGSQYLGYGIYSLDADFRVQAQCTANPPPGPGQACPVGEHNPTLFQGLDHGIHARTGTTLRNFTVDRAQFTDNIAGVYTEGVIGYKVVHSLFEVGGRNVDLTNPIEFPNWFGFHRGIYTYTGHAFIPDFNHFARSGPAPAEGIVIGYSLDHNDMVFGNSAEDIDNAYVGEGICLSLDPEGPNIGLQLLCNDNEDNEYNLTARIALSADLDEWPSHGIRASQGDTYRAAGNTFDRDLTVLDVSDYRNDTERAFDYFYEGENTEYQPADYNTDLIALFPVVGGMVEPCASRMLVIVTEDPPGMVIAGEHLQEMKLAYGNTRYQYEQLLDGGNTDEVVQQIVDTWPQDVWDLRDQLLAMSPYLSDTTLRKLVNSPTVPDAIKTELLIANPEGVRNHGIVPWVLAEELLPTYMVAQIVASWDQRTYRFTLENDMGHFHSAMSQAATRLLSYHAADSTYDHLDSLITTWQEIRTPAARYSEAMGYLERGRYTNAAYAVQSIPQEHKRINHKYLSEKDRMLGYISFLESVHLSGRELNELDSTEVAQLQSLIAGKHDRPAVWAQNLLCFHYGLCSPPHTGGKSSTPKAFPLPENTEGVVEGPQLGIMPNPAAVYVAINYDLKAAADGAFLMVRDVAGRTTNVQALGHAEGQVVLDTRRMPTGIYTVELHNAGERLLTQKLIVQQ